MVLRKDEMAGSSTEPGLTHRVKGEKRFVIDGVRCAHDDLYLDVSEGLSIGNIHKASTKKLAVNHFFLDSLYEQCLKDQTFSTSSGL